MNVKVVDMHKLIPHGLYCYDEHGVCPAWGMSENHPKQENGFCTYMMLRDWEDEGVSLLWDQVKECGINLCWEEYEGG